MSDEIITTISPITNQVLYTRRGISAEDLQQLPRVAEESFLSFSKTSLADRQEIITKALKILESRKDVLASELTAQIGRPISYAEKEIFTAVKRAQYLVKISEDVFRDIPGEAEQGFKRYIRKFPIGPVLIIFAWNVGNSVILKPSPQTPTIVEHISSIFLEAGLPRNVIQYFYTGSPAITETIIRDPKIRLICFTGSLKSGLSVQKVAAERVVNVGLELGGKDPAYIRPDVDISWASREIVDGAIFNSGQSCCSLERIYVNEAIYAEFIESIQTVLKTYEMGDPWSKTIQIGPVISKRSKEVIESHIKDALEKGAIDATPENTSFKASHLSGNFVKPTLLVNVNHDMLVMNEETFGPIIPIMKVKDDSEAIQLMNKSMFGLTASIWTKDIQKGTEIAEEVDAGTVFVNRCDFPSPVSHEKLKL